MMKWSSILALGLVLVALAAIGIWGYQFFIAPESVVSITEKWERSGHADASSRAFTNWDNADPPLVPQNCARCHSPHGYLDFLGADGSAAGQVDGPAPIGSVLYCNTCHNTPAHTLSAVKFPSGIETQEHSGSANCMQCHQGRAAATTVDNAIAGRDPDAVAEGLNFINIHYGVAAATLLGAEAQGGYQYGGKAYVGRFEHVEDYRTCVQCHDAHSTAINPDTCSPCHLNVVSSADLRNIRQSKVDHDGDGDVSAPIAAEIAVLHSTLYAAIQEYAAKVAGAPIVYEKNTFPYFFIDTNANGIADGNEVNAGNRYVSWTPRLLQAAYNYNFVNKDRGAYAHNPRYVLQLLYDSLEDMGQRVSIAEIARYTRP